MKGVSGMKSLSFLAVALVLIASPAMGETIFYLNFDEAADVIAASGTIYVPGSTEIVNPAAAGLGSATIFFVDSGAPDDVNEIAADGASIGTPTGVTGHAQGGKALLTDSGGCDEGLRIQVDNTMLNQSFTMEAIWFTKNVAGTGNNSGIQTIMGDNWPQLNILYEPDPLRSQFQFNCRNAGQSEYYGDQSAGFSLYGESVNASNVWTHDAMVFEYNAADKSKCKLSAYRNGLLVGQKIYDASTAGEEVGLFGKTVLNGNSLTIGMINSFEYRINDHRRGLNGGVDAIAISNEALVPANFVLPFESPAVPEVRTGNHAVKINNNNLVWTGDMGLDIDSNRIPVVAGHQVQLVFWARNGHPETSSTYSRVSYGRFSSTGFMGDTNYFANQHVPSFWVQKKSTVLTLAANTAFLNVAFRPGADSSIVIDDVQLIDITAGNVDLMQNGGMESWTSQGGTLVPYLWRFFAVSGAVGTVEMVGDLPTPSTSIMPLLWEGF